MATSTNTYGTSTGVERLVGDIVVNRSFTTASIPTLAQVEQFLDQTASDLNVALSAAGYAVPVSTTSVIARQWLQNVNEKCAAALVLTSIPMTAIAPGSESAGTNRIQVWANDCLMAIKRIDEKKLNAPRSRGRLGASFAGSQEDSDGRRKLPVFKRSLDDFPSRHTRTE